MGSFIDRDHVLEDVSACVSEALDETQLQVNSLVYHNLLVHICIALMRIGSGHYVPLEGLSVERLKTSPVYPVAEDIAGRIAEKLNVTLPESEVAYIAIHLAGKRTLGSDDADDGNLAISDEVWSIVSEMLDLIKLDFHFDFSADLELRMNLARHIVPLGTRLRYHLSMENPIREDIKARYPLAFSMASDAVSVLARTYESMPSEDELHRAGVRAGD